MPRLQQYRIEDYPDKKTERTKYFWLDGGHLYIYTIYMPSNICLNVVAGLAEQPEAVLIRAVQPVEGVELVKEFRKIKSGKVEELSNGPGKVGQALGIDMPSMNGMNMVGSHEFRIVDGGLSGYRVGVSRRINIEYAEEWRDKPWRFFVEGNSFVSKVKLDSVVTLNKKKSKPKK
jgi:DNA-3-methyladenine glycosylase